MDAATICRVAGLQQPELSGPGYGLGSAVGFKLALSDQQAGED
jgi:hypothetical protein